MRDGGSKSKGSSFERDCCVQLSLWISKGERQDLLWRSAMSGGRATVQHAKGKDNTTQCGDISAVDPLGHHLTRTYVVECKHYRNLNITSGLLQGRGNLSKFWRETVGLSKRHKKHPMLVAKQNHFPVFVVLDYYGLQALGLREKLLVRSEQLFRGETAYVVWFKDMLAEGNLLGRL
jgi:hypothetical protein